MQPFPDTDLSGHGAEPQTLFLQDHPAGDLSQGPRGSFPDPPSAHQALQWEICKRFNFFLLPRAPCQLRVKQPQTVWDLGGMLPARKPCKKASRAAPSGSGYKELIGQERLKSMNHVFIALLEGLPKNVRREVRAGWAPRVL